MKPLIILCLSLPLAAQGSLQATLPGRDKDLYHREQDRKKVAEATVDVVGTLDPAQVRQMRFQEFMGWFIPDLRAYLGRYGRVAEPVPAAIQLTQPPVEARVYPLGTGY